MTPEQKYYYLKHRMEEIHGWLSNLLFVKEHPDHVTSKPYLLQLDSVIEEGIDAVELSLKDAEDDSICHASCKLGMYWCSLKKGHKENHSMRGWLTWVDNFCDKWEE